MQNKTKLKSQIRATFSMDLVHVTQSRQEHIESQVMRSVSLKMTGGRLYEVAEVW
jgi:hypothetical protein